MQLLVMGTGFFKSLLVVVHTPTPTLVVWWLSQSHFEKVISLWIMQEFIVFAWMKFQSSMCTVGTCLPQPATVEGEKEAIYHCVSSEQILSWQLFDVNKESTHDILGSLLTEKPHKASHFHISSALFHKSVPGFIWATNWNVIQVTTRGGKGFCRS